MYNGKARKIWLAAISVLLIITFTACGNSGDPSDTGRGSDVSGTDNTPVTDNVTASPEPVIDPDADTLDGIVIRSAEELAMIGTNSKYPMNGDYFLVADIDLSGIESWEPIGGAPGKSGEFTGDYVFSGTFDGRGHRINGLTIDDSADRSSYWGLFGTVGSKKSGSPAVIKNIVFTNVNIAMTGNTDLAVGTLAGQVNGYAEIDSISLLSGSVAFDGSGCLGTGGLIGQCRTQRSGKISNEGISITNIFSNVTVTANNSGWDTGGGIIGRIRDSHLGRMSNVVLIAQTMSEGQRAYAMASGDRTAKKSENLYYMTGVAQTRDKFGTSTSSQKLSAGGVSLSDKWTVREGMYPILTAVLEKPTFSIMDFAMIEFAEGESASRVRGNFKLPVTVLGQSVSWSSGNEAVIKISDKTAQVSPPEDGAVDVTLTADYGTGTKDYTFHVVGRLNVGGYFITKYVVADKPIELGGYAEGTTFEWTIMSQATGKKRTVTTDKPTLTLGEGDVESFITVRAEGYEDITTYYSYLPIMYITGKTKYKAVGSNDYTDVEMKLCAGEEYADLLYDGSAGIRLRGNSTSRLAKKPFKVKLDKKANLLGIDKEGKNKHWCLLANALDPTVMRNKILMDFSQAIGTEAYVASENIVLIYNGEYCGVYQLAEHVRVDETRVNIFDWEEYAEDAAEALAEKLRADGKIEYSEVKGVAAEIEESMIKDWSWMKKGSVKYKNKTYKFTDDLGLPALPPQTGGFLLEMDFYSMNDWNTLARTQTAYAQPLYFNTPEPVGEDSLYSFYNTDLFEYTYNYIQSFEYAIHSDDFIYRNSDPHYYAANWWSKWEPRDYQEMAYRDDVNDGLHYSEMFDMENLVQNFIFCEVVMNWDSMKNSFFVYKDVDKLAKIGPQWDFDWAWGNVLWNGATWQPTSWHCREESFMVEQYYQEVQWNCLLIRDPYFLTKVWEMWEELRPTAIEGLVGKKGTLSTYRDYIRKAALANDGRWSKEVARGATFDSEIERMNMFVSERMEWLDKQFASIDSLIKSLGVYHASDKITVTDVSVGAKETTITAGVSDESIKYVNFQINGTTSVEAPVSGGFATVKVDNSKLDADGYNCVVASARNGSHEYIIDAQHSITGNYNQVVSNYKSFKMK